MLAIDARAVLRGPLVPHRQALMDSAATLSRRIEVEYLEMPGLCLTFEQACRLFGVPAPTCDCLMQALVADGFLRRTGRGHFVRA